MMSFHIRCIRHSLQARLSLPASLVSRSFIGRTKRPIYDWVSSAVRPICLQSSVRVQCFSTIAPSETFAFFDPPVHPASIHALTHKLKLTNPTEIQSKSYEAARTGRDVLARARTGTGKTLAFLLPAIENALANVQPFAKRKIEILVLCPTRELANQIHSTSQVLAASHSNSSDSIRMHSQVMFGGVSRDKDVQKLNEKLPFILVATPGRLLDHMENSFVGGKSFGEILGGISVLVLDEADRCLNMGFQQDMQQILQILERNKTTSSQPRQTLLFSATLPKRLRSIMASALRNDFITVDCVKDEDPTTQTNATVHQTFLTLPDPKDKMVSNDLHRLSPGKKQGNPNNSLDLTQYRWISGLVDILEDIIHVQNPTDYKVVVFFATTSAAQFFSYVFNEVYKIPVIEIHSRKAQSNRTSCSKLFRNTVRGILFTTDVSARGVDYPNVTHVIQYGPAEDRETYIHRVGRTARAGQNGIGILVLGSKGEERTVLGQELKGLNLKRNKRYQDLILGETIVQDGDGGGGINGFINRKRINEKRLQKIHTLVGVNSESKAREYATQVYRSFLGYYTTKMKSVGMMYKVEVVEYVNALAIQMGFRRDNLPALNSLTVQRIGLEGIRGLNVSNNGSDTSEDLGSSIRRRNKSQQKSPSKRNKYH